MKEFCIYFLLFMIYSIMGWLYEVIAKLITEHRFVNRGFLIGPYCPIYGWGGILITFGLKKYMDDPFVLFILIVLICSLLEYYTSYFLEKIFKLRWWDYSHFKFNINGRICLETMIPFGICGMLGIYYVSPFFIKLLNGLSNPLLYVLAIVLFVVYIVDTLISESIVGKISKMGKEVNKEIIKKYHNVLDNTEMIKELFIKKITDSKNYLHERVIKAFPNFELKIPFINNLFDDKDK